MSQLKITVSGPAGAGKTTLAHTLYLLLTQQLGQVRILEGFTITLDPSVEKPHDLRRNLAGLAARGTEIVIIERPESRKMAALTPDERADLEAWRQDHEMRYGYERTEKLSKRDACDKLRTNLETLEIWTAREINEEFGKFAASLPSDRTGVSTLRKLLAGLAEKLGREPEHPSLFDLMQISGRKASLVALDAAIAELFGEQGPDLVTGEPDPNAVYYTPSPREQEITQEEFEKTK